jgi:hypothetical protein
MAKKDLSKLTKKTVTGKDGKKHVVWVNANGKPSKKQRDKKVEATPTPRESKVSDMKLRLAGVADMMEDTSKEIGSKVKDWKSKQEAFYSGDNEKSKEIDAAMSKQLKGEFGKLSIGQEVSGIVRKKAKGFVKGIKEEVHEWKEAGGALVKLGKGQSVSKEEKKAIMKVAIHTAIVVGSTAVSGGLAGGAAAVAKGLGIHFAEHNLLVQGARALAFAKAMEEGDDKAAEEALEQMVMQYADFIEKHA